jgi:hypothetical protein
MTMDDAIACVPQLPLKRDMPVSPFIAMGSDKGAIGRHHALNGRGFFPALERQHPHSTRLPRRDSDAPAAESINKGETPCDGKLLRW